MRRLMGIAGSIVLLPAMAQAVIHNGVFQADEAQATTCAAGSITEAVGTVTYDDVTNNFTWSYTYGDNAPNFDDGDLVGGGTETVAHFHGPAAPGATAPPTVTTAMGPTNPSNGAMVITAGQGADLLAGLWYMNVHSTTCMSGEIRGQVTFPAAVPSLSHWGVAALLAGLLGVVVAARRSGLLTPAR